MTRTISCISTMLIALLFISCGSGGGGSSSGGGGVGTLSLSLTDASTDRYKAVYVTITDIQVHQPGGNENNPNSWYSVDMPRTPMTVNLLDLVNGVREDLGLVDLEAGAYTQMRLIIGQTPERNGTINILSQPHPYANYVVDLNDDYHELKVPSGSQSGYKIIGGFDINTNSTTELILDFDANRSVVEAGNSGQWLLKPTVKVKYPDEDALIEGRVTDSTAGVSGALVSAQVFHATGPLEDQVAIQASTVTDSNGYYELFVEDGTYNLVVFSPNHETQSRTVTAGPGTVVTGNFILTSRGMGTFTGTVTIAGASVEQYATLSFRQTAGSDQIEVYSINVRNGFSYSVSLPYGDYTIVASSYSATTTSYSGSVSVGGTTPVNIAL
jgi:hypothetical protein